MAWCRTSYTTSLYLNQCWLSSMKICHHDTRLQRVNRSNIQWDIISLDNWPAPRRWLIMQLMMAAVKKFNKSLTLYMLNNFLTNFDLHLDLMSLWIVRKQAINIQPVVWMMLWARASAVMVLTNLNFSFSAARVDTIPAGDLVMHVSRASTGYWTS